MTPGRPPRHQIIPPCLCRPSRSRTIPGNHPADGSVQDFETRFRRRDGTIIDVRITATIRKNKKGGVAGYEGFVTDITDRKQTERALQDSEEKYRIVVETSFPQSSSTRAGSSASSTTDSRRCWGMTIRKMLLEDLSGMSSIRLIGRWLRKGASRREKPEFSPHDIFLRHKKRRHDDMGRFEGDARYVHGKSRRRGKSH